MAEVHDPGLSVERLAARIQEAAMLPDTRPMPSGRSGTAGALRSPGTGEEGSAAGLLRQVRALEMAPLVLQPGFQPKDDDRYHVGELLQYHDRNFIQNAYRAILKRGPDATGFTAFANGLRGGRLNKIDILARLRFSSEGRAKKVEVSGLFLPAAIRQAYRVPVLGYLLHLGIALARLPALVRDEQQFQAHVLAQHEQFAEKINHVGASLVNYAQDATRTLTALSEELQRQTDRAAEQYAAMTAAHESSRAEVNQRLDQLQRHLESRLDQLQIGLEIEIKSGRSDLESRLDQLQRHLELRVDDVSSDARGLFDDVRNETRDLVRGLKAEVERTFQKQQQIRTELTLQGQRMTRVLDEAKGRLSAPMDRAQPQVVSDEDLHNLDAFYVSLEDRFRGHADEIKKRLQVYIPLLRKAGIGSSEMPVLDVGCGRGEWLELLREEGFSSSGVDFNRVLVAECRARGLKVLEGDALDYLRRLPDESLGAVTGFHIAEHLTIEVLVKLLDEMVRVVKPGGAVIFETPNPRNVLVGSCNFYFDPTHRNPLPAPIMQFLLESRGLSEVEIIELNPSDTVRIEGDGELVRRFNEYFYGPMDYAVVGWRRKVEDSQP